MATPLDFGLLKVMHNVFPFLFVLILTYALLVKFPLFKDNQFFAASISFILAVLSMFSPIFVKTIQKAAPWFVLLLVFIVLLLVVYQAFGVTEKTILDTISSEDYSSLFANGMIALMLMIILGNLASVISEEKGFSALTSEGVPIEDEQTGFFKVIFHPKVLGFATVMLIALFTVLRLSQRD